jgi:uncharacterized protein (DUF1810 family)
VSDPFTLQRFLDAHGPVYAQVCAELRTARKRSHWMWFIFPQLQGLGASHTARFYAISSLAEARAYLEHEVLGERLRECTRLVNQVEGCGIEAIFGYPDHLKFHSCMTLFARAAGDANAAAPFREALRKYFAGEEDPLTRERLT